MIYVILKILSIVLCPFEQVLLRNETHLALVTENPLKSFPANPILTPP